MNNDLPTVLFGFSLDPDSGTIFDRLGASGVFTCDNCDEISDPVAMDIPGVVLCEDCAETAPALVIGVGQHFDHFRQMIEGNETWTIRGEAPDEKGRGVIFALVRKSLLMLCVTPGGNK